MTQSWNCVSWNQIIFNMKVTLTCSNCGEECPWDNPFKPDDDKSIAEQGWDNICKAHCDHRVKGCRRVERA